MVVNLDEHVIVMEEINKVVVNANKGSHPKKYVNVMKESMSIESVYISVKTITHFMHVFIVHVLKVSFSIPSLSAIVCPYTYSINLCIFNL